MSICRAIAAGIVALSVSGCASVRSIPAPGPGTNSGDGLVYYLPERHVVVTLTVSDKKHTLTIAESDAFPDMNARYVARFRRNQVGKNAISIATTSSGLLHGDSTSTTTPQITEIFEAIASSSAGIGVHRRTETAGQAEPCAPDGTYLLIFNPSRQQQQPGRLCQYSIVATDLAKEHISEVSAPSKEDYGLYYRRPLPYLVTVTGPGGGSPVAQKIVLVPNSNSPIALLRAPRALFATSTGAFTFSYGLPTKYEQELDSELLGLVKLPAEVLKAYFTAVGAAFDGFKAGTAAETQYLQAVNAAAVQDEKTRLCLEAVAGGEPQAIASACGN